MTELILPGKGRRLVQLLLARRGRATLLHLRDGRRAVAWNCAWGRTWNRDWEHLTLNLAPRVRGEPVWSLSSAEVTAAFGEDGTELLYRNSDAQNDEGARPTPRPLKIEPGRLDQPRFWIGT